MMMKYYYYYFQLHTSNDWSLYPDSLNIYIYIYVLCKYNIYVAINIIYIMFEGIHYIHICLVV